MNNYRANIKVKFPKSFNYWKNFDEARTLQYEMIQEIRWALKDKGIIYIWWFYEPHIEITWLDNGGFLGKKEAFEIVEQIARGYSHFESIKFMSPEDGNFGDWFCENEREREFGALRHHYCAELAELFEIYDNDIIEGKGRIEQYKRTLHTLANPLALNYTDEAKACFSRGLICLLFRFFSFKRAVFIYTKIFRQKY